MFPDLLRQGLVHPLAVEWVGAAELEINPRTGKLKRVLDRRHA
jgi:phenylacetate-CoA ligase